MPKLDAYDKSLPYSYALGLFPCHALLDSRPVAARRLLIDEEAAGDGVDKLRERCRALGIREEIASKALRRESRKQNCHAALVFDKFQDALCDRSPHVVLHEVSDAGNLGTILRTCLGFGMRDIAVIRPAADVFDPHVIRASMGAAFALRVAVYDGFDVYRATYPHHALYPFMLDGAIPLEQAAREAAQDAAQDTVRDAALDTVRDVNRDVAVPYALVFGNEARGLPTEFAGLGRAVVIPHSGAIDSLNVAVAVGIGVYAFSEINKREI